MAMITTMRTSTATTIDGGCGFPALASFGLRPPMLL